MILFILQGHEFIFFVQIAFQAISFWNFTHIHRTSLFLVQKSSVFFKLTSLKFEFFKKNGLRVMHKCVNFQDRIRWNQGCAKKTNLNLFNTWYYSSKKAMNLSFLYRSHFKLFHSEILHTYTKHPCLLVQKKFRFFWNSQVWNLNFSKKKASVEAESQNASLFICSFS